MKKKLTSIIVVLILLGTILSACNRPASEDPTLKPTDAFPFPVSPTQGVSQFATQTAAAKAPRGRTVFLVECFEKLIQPVWRDANTGIRDTEI